MKNFNIEKKINWIKSKEKINNESDKEKVNKKFYKSSPPNNTDILQ